MITALKLVKLGVPADKADEYEGPLISAAARYQINTVPRVAAWLAQLIHESNGLRTVQENLNYTPDALINTFGKKRFPLNLAQQFGRTANHPANQSMIAMIAYADRMGNGGVDSGDGWKFRGRGPLQLTGRDNYRRAGAAIGLDLEAAPDRVLEPVVGALVSGWFWGQGTGKSLNALADAGKIDSISRAWNGGDNGLGHRRSLYEQLVRVLS